MLTDILVIEQLLGCSDVHGLSSQVLDEQLLHAAIIAVGQG
jgi:hypothetical protein